MTALVRLPRRPRCTLLSVSASALALCAAGCSSSGKGDAGNAGDGSTIDSSTSGGSTSGGSTTGSATTGAARSDAATSTTDASHAGSVDVCALLSPADASAVAQQFSLSGDPAATYKLIAEKQPPPTTAYPSSACRFTIVEVTADNTGSEAIVTVGVQPAKYLDTTGTKIAGLGDEAYDEGPYVEVRVGDVVLESNENSGASKDFINALYRRMVTKVS